MPPCSLGWGHGTQGQRPLGTAGHVIRRAEPPLAALETPPPALSCPLQRVHRPRPPSAPAPAPAQLPGPGHPHRSLQIGEGTSTPPGPAAQEGGFLEAAAGDTMPGPAVGGVLPAGLYPRRESGGTQSRVHRGLESHAWAPGCPAPSGRAPDGADSLLGSALCPQPLCARDRVRAHLDPHGSPGRWPQQSHLPKVTDGKRWANPTRASSLVLAPRALLPVDSTEHSREDETWGPEVRPRAGGTGRQGRLALALAFSSVKWPQHPTQRAGRRPGAGCPGTTPRKPSTGWVCALPAHAHRLVTSSGRGATVSSGYPHSSRGRELEAEGKGLAGSRRKSPAWPHCSCL